MQLKIKDAMDAVEKLREEIKNNQVSGSSTSCDCNCDCSALEAKVNTLEKTIQTLAKELREHIDMYNAHIRDLHINR